MLTMNEAGRLVINYELLLWIHSNGKHKQKTTIGPRLRNFRNYLVTLQ